MVIASPMPSKVPSDWSLGLEPMKSNSKALKNDDSNWHSCLPSLRCIVMIGSPLSQRFLIYYNCAGLHRNDPQIPVLYKQSIMVFFFILFVFLHHLYVFYFFLVRTRTLIFAINTLCQNYKIVKLFFLSDCD